MFVGKHVHEVAEQTRMAKIAGVVVVVERMV
jgi:hypothetical protein